jgi:hypothetical protein
MVLLLKDLRIIFLYFNHPANVGGRISRKSIYLNLDFLD